MFWISFGKNWKLEMGWKIKREIWKRRKLSLRKTFFGLFFKINFWKRRKRWNFGTFKEREWNREDFRIKRNFTEKIKDLETLTWLENTREGKRILELFYFHKEIGRRIINVKVNFREKFK